MRGLDTSCKPPGYSLSLGDGNGVLAWGFCHAQRRGRKGAHSMAEHGESAVRGRSFAPGLITLVLGDKQ